jgi:hypothetical protein
MSNNIEEIIQQESEFILPHIKLQFNKLKNKDFKRPYISKPLNDKLAFRKFFKRNDEKIKKAIYDSITILSSENNKIQKRYKGSTNNRHSYIGCANKNYRKS